MSIESGIVSVLRADGTVSGIISTRIYPLKLKEGYALPALSYQRVSSVREHNIDVGPIGFAWARFQIDSWAESYTDVRSLAEAVRQCLDGYKGTMGGVNAGGICIKSERDLFEEGTEIYRVIQDYLIPYHEIP